MEISQSKHKQIQAQPEIYRFVGDGLGVPGLPHEISRSEAQDLGVEELLDQAIQAGVYSLNEE